MTPVLFILCVLAQGADYVTYASMDPARELNPLVIAMGPLSVIPKALLIALLALMCAAAGRGRVARLVLIAGTVAGVVGAASNL